MTKKKNFYKWLMGFYGSDTAYGDVAKAVSVDKYAKLLPDKLDAWLDHVDPLKNSTFHVLTSDLFGMFLADLDSGGTTGKIKARDDDDTEDEWSIIAPVIPNYTSENGTLNRVFSRPSLLRIDYATQFETDYFPSYNRVFGAVYGDAVEMLGSFFRREFRYDFKPYTWDSQFRGDYNKLDGGLRINSYLFVAEDFAPTCRAIGACSFSRRSDESRWVMDFVYFHPNARRQGFLSKAWDTFQGVYGDFWTSYPISDAMRSFLEKRGELDRHANQYYGT